MLIIFKDTFFQNLKPLFLDPVFDLVSQTTFPDFNNLHVTIPEVGEVTFSIQGLTIPIIELQNTKEESLIELKDDSVKFNIKGMNLRVQFVYSYVSDPPLFADYGEFELDMQNLNFVSEVKTSYEQEGYLNVTIMEFQFDVDPILVDLDGMSETSDLITRVLTTFVNWVTDRLMSIQRYQKLRNFWQLNRFVNSLIQIIPDEIDLPFSNTYVQGGIAGNFRIINHENRHKFLVVPMDLSYHNTEHPLGEENERVFMDSLSLDSTNLEQDQLTVYLSEYLLNSFFNVAFYLGFLSGEVPIDIDTTILDAALLNQLSKNGYEQD